MDLVFLTTEGTENTEEVKKGILGGSGQCEIELKRRVAIQASASRACETLTQQQPQKSLCSETLCPLWFIIAGQHFSLCTRNRDELEKAVGLAG